MFCSQFNTCISNIPPFTWNIVLQFWNLGVWDRGYGGLISFEVCPLAYRWLSSLCVFKHSILYVQISSSVTWTPHILHFNLVILVMWSLPLLAHFWGVILVILFFWLCPYLLKININIDISLFWSKSGIGVILLSIQKGMDIYVLF